MVIDSAGAMTPPKPMRRAYRGATTTAAPQSMLNANAQTPELPKKSLGAYHRNPAVNKTTKLTSPDEMGCCFGIGFRANMKPCCMKFGQMSKAACLLTKQKPPSAAEGGSGWRWARKCPSSAKEAFVWTLKGNAHRFSEDFARKAPRTYKTNKLTLTPLSTKWKHLYFRAVDASRDYLESTDTTFVHGSSATDKEYVNGLRERLYNFNDGSAYSFAVLSPDEKSCLGAVTLFPVDHTREYLPTSVEVESWMIPEATVGDLDIHLTEELVKWLTSQWGFTEVQFRVPDSSSRGMHVAETAGLDLTTSSLGPPGQGFQFFVNQLELFSGPGGRAVRPGCKAHAECGKKADFCMVEDDSQGYFENVCSSCKACDDEVAIDGHCPQTPACQRMVEIGRQEHDDDDEEL
jgi:hypothetical protein